jgi:hypothetical protein
MIWQDDTSVWHQTGSYRGTANSSQLGGFRDR